MCNAAGSTLGFLAFPLIAPLAAVLITAVPVLATIPAALAIGSKTRNAAEAS